jgi:hypothetical protein
MFETHVYKFQIDTKAGSQTQSVQEFSCNIDAAAHTRVELVGGV